MLRLTVAAPLACQAIRPPRVAAASPPPPSACVDCARRKLEGRPKSPREERGLIVAVAASRSRPTFENDDEKTSTSSSSSSSEPDPGASRPDDPLPLRAALAALRFYRSSISPALPKSCRFLPTCSEYAQRSYRRFGVVRGTVLTAWRLLRCQPFNPGREFYDPPRWPPVGLEFAFGGEIEEEKM